MMHLHNGQEYCKRNFELQEKLRRSEEDRIKLEERFYLLRQQSQNRHEACINKLKMRYIEFLEDQRERDERSHKLTGTLDRIDSNLIQMNAKKDMLNAATIRYEKSLQPKDGNLKSAGSIALDNGNAGKSETKSIRTDNVIERKPNPVLERNGGLLPHVYEGLCHYRTYSPVGSTQSSQGSPDTPSNAYYKTQVMNYPHLLKRCSPPKVSETTKIQVNKAEEIYKENCSVERYLAKLRGLERLSSLRNSQIDNELANATPSNSAPNAQTFSTLLSRHDIILPEFSALKTYDTPEHLYPSKSINPDLNVSPPLNESSVHDVKNFSLPRERDTTYASTSFPSPPSYDPVAPNAQDSHYDSVPGRSFDIRTFMNTKSFPRLSYFNRQNKTISPVSGRMSRMLKEKLDAYNVRQKTTTLLENELDYYISKIRKLQCQNDIDCLSDDADMGISPNYGYKADMMQSRTPFVGNGLSSASTLPTLGTEQGIQSQSEFPMSTYIGRTKPQESINRDYTSSYDLSSTTGRDAPMGKYDKGLGTFDKSGIRDRSTPLTSKLEFSQRNFELPAQLAENGYHNTGGTSDTRQNADEIRNDQIDSKFTNLRKSFSNDVNLGNLCNGNEGATEYNFSIPGELEPWNIQLYEKRVSEIQLENVNNVENEVDSENVETCSKQEIEVTEKISSTDSKQQHLENVTKGNAQNSVESHQTSVNNKYPDGSNGSEQQCAVNENQEYPEDSHQQYSYDPNQEYMQDPNYDYGQDPAAQYAQDSNQQYSEHPDQEYTEDPNQQYTAQTEQQYTAHPDEQYTEQTDQQYVEHPEQQYTAHPDEQYTEQTDQQYVEHPEQQYTAHPDEQYTEQTDQQGIDHPDQQYTQQTDQQYIEHPDQQYTQQTDQQYIEHPDQQYTEQTDGEYIEQPDQQYTGQIDQQYAEHFDQQYVEQTDQHYNEQIGQQYSENPDQQYPEEINQEYSEKADQQYSEYPEQQYIGETEQQYSEYPEQQFTQYPTEQNTENLDQQYTEDQQYVEGGNEGYAEDMNQQCKEDPNQQYNTSATCDPNYAYDETQYLHSEDGQEERTSGPAETLEKDAKKKLESVEENKKKDVIQLILNSDTDSTIEQNPSNTESDFDFN